MKCLRTLKLGNIILSPALALAPMAGVTDLAFREICTQYGATYTCTEMVSAKALCFHDKKTQEILKSGINPQPFAVQIFGSEPECMAKAAQLALEISGASVVDINMGCPMPKIVKSGDGCALMKNVSLACQIVSAVKNSVHVPVTVKHRAGWSFDDVNAVSFAQAIEQAGADALCVHGRTATQLYSGVADRTIIAKVKQAVKIPVFANGDIQTAEDAVAMLSETNVDGIAIGRGAVGNPWIFQSIQQKLSEPSLHFPEITLKEKLDTAFAQIKKASLYKGERIALLEARRHIACYLKGIPNIKIWKEHVYSLSKLDEIEQLFNQILSSLS